MPNITETQRNFGEEAGRETQVRDTTHRPATEIAQPLGAANKSRTRRDPDRRTNMGSWLPVSGRRFLAVCGAWWIIAILPPPPPSFSDSDG